MQKNFTVFDSKETAIAIEVGPPSDKAKRRSYNGAAGGNLYGNWASTNYSANAELYGSLESLRGRSRELSRNNDYAKRFFKMVQRNVVGRNGFKLQMRINDIDKDGKKKPDKMAIEQIETAWKSWCRKDFCDASGKYSFIQMQNMIMKHVPLDGEVILRKVRGKGANKYGFALQLIESDHIDTKYNINLPNGNAVKMGIELGKYGKPVAYHIWNQHPGDTTFATLQHRKRIRVPADEIIHLYVPDRISQNRGLPWIHAAMNHLNMLGSYEEAELVASRIASNKSGIWEPKPDEDGEYFVGDDEDDDGTIILESEPGKDRIGPAGYEWKANHPDHPTTAFGTFIKSMLKGISSGLDVTYNYLANDYEGVNYSSLRGAEMETRDAWRTLQTWLIEYFLVPVFEEWLENAMMSGEITLPFSKFEKFNQPRFFGRVFQWVDPKNEMAALALALGMGITAPGFISKEYNGEDIEDVYQMIADNKDSRDLLNIVTMDDAKIIKLVQVLLASENDDENKTTEKQPANDAG